MFGGLWSADTCECFGTWANTHDALWHALSPSSLRRRRPALAKDIRSCPRLRDLPPAGPLPTLSPLGKARAELEEATAGKGQAALGRAPVNIIQGGYFYKGYNFEHTNKSRI